MGLAGAIFSPTRPADWGTSCRFIADYVNFPEEKLLWRKLKLKMLASIARRSKTNAGWEKREATLYSTGLAPFEKLELLASKTPFSFWAVFLAKEWQEAEASGTGG